MLRAVSRAHVISWLNFRLLSAVLGFAFVSCDSPRKSALRELSAAGVEVSGKSLVDAVAGGTHDHARLLLQAGVHTERRDADGRTPLRIAVDRKDSRMVSLLLDSGANPNAVMDDGTSVLSAAVVSGDSALADRLMNAGASPDARAPDGESLLCRAILNGLPVTAASLVKHGADPHQAGLAGDAPLHLALAGGHVALAAALLEAGATATPADLHLALGGACRDIIPRLIRAGADPNLPGPDGRTPLERALAAEDTALFRVLLESGASPAYCGPSGRSATHHALAGDWEEAWKILAEAGADLNLPDTSGQTPLDAAFASGNRGAFAFLLSRGAQPGARGWTPGLWRALERRDIQMARLLLDHGAKPDMHGPGGWLPVEAAAFMGSGSFVKLLLDHGGPAGGALHIAAARGDRDMVSLLLACGVSPAPLPVPSTDCPLAAALRGGHDRTACLLLDAGAHGNIRPPEGQTALHLAIATGCHRAVRRLLDTGADPNAAIQQPVSPDFIRRVRPGVMRWVLKSDGNITPLMLAADSGVTESVRHLLDAGAEKSVWTRVARLWPINFASRRADIRTMRVLLGRDPYHEEHHIVISLSEQYARMFDADGNEIFSTKVSTGRKGFATPTGEFVITNKHRAWTSTIYDASMPYFQRLSCSDFGLHQGFVPGYPASHGCIRVPAGNAAKLFAMTRAGDRVRIIP